MAKHTAKAKGKHSITTLQGEDGCFIPSLPHLPGSLSQSAPGLPPQPEQEVSGTPMHPGGLGYLDSSLSERFYTLNLCPEADLELDENCEKEPPSRNSPPLRSPPRRSLSIGIPVNLPCHAPVTIETVTDKDITARCRSHTEITSPEVGSHIHVEQVTSSSDIIMNNAPISVNTHDHPLSKALILQEFAPEACSPGLADIENLLNETYESTGLSRNMHNRNLSSIEQELREYTDHAEQQTQAALDLNHRALGLLMESMENTKKARAQVICTQHCVNELLSVSLHHHKCMHSIQHSPNDGITSIICEAGNQH